MVFVVEVKTTKISPTKYKSPQNSREVWDRGYSTQLARVLTMPTTIWDHIANMEGVVSICSNHEKDPRIE